MSLLVAAQKQNSGSHQSSQSVLVPPATARASAVHAPALPTNAKATTVRGATLRCEAEVGEGAVAIRVHRELRHLSAAQRNMCAPSWSTVSLLDLPRAL